MLFGDPKEAFEPVRLINTSFCKKCRNSKDGSYNSGSKKCTECKLTECVSGYEKYLGVEIKNLV